MSDLIRRIKCDETPDACKNCISTGRICEGYDMHRLPPTKKVAPKATWDVMPGIVNGFYWTMTSDEQRCYSYYRFSVVPALIGSFSSPLWENLVFQMSYAEPAVYHAVIGLSAVQRESPNSKPSAAKGSWNKFALEQLGRSFSLLRRRSTSQDPQLPTVTLICCLLFVTLELLQGQYEVSFTHLRNGLDIIKKLKAHKQLVPGAFDKSPVEQCLVAAFAHMDNQVAYFRTGEPILDLDDWLEGYLANKTAFRNLGEVRQTLEPLLSAIMRFVTRSATDTSPLLPKQKQLMSQLTDFSRLFDSFRESSYAMLNPFQLIGADLMLLRQRTLFLTLDTCLLPLDDPSLDNYNQQYEEIISIAELIMRKAIDHTSLTIDIGVIPPLCHVALNCQDPTLRWRAIHAVRSWPYQDGPWDSSRLARITMETIKIHSYSRKAWDERVAWNQDITGRSPSGLLPRNNYVMISPDHRHGCIPYMIAGVRKFWWFSFLDDDLNSANGFVLSDVTGWTPIIASRLRFRPPGPVH
ncbi:hypothetical protein BO94DRAFT_583723 [Aspergillus sclerotioniger CBS 115572]|uniref:C6 zinc finger domain protein n=1 Tax=Aspergillus sclerotioniger CBS 115572 TaxID=1450535 RepID=A0A317X0U1_9EURO|nr:hypothetical protein BO94DRAFT_583723 [Aspergillus sclerotioniger CBS 115572]PWY91791.1 hypothetical protein BO94DRAFT_583723 [Aspergillus sclerotioniger CBS 115572]